MIMRDHQISNFYIRIYYSVSQIAQIVGNIKGFVFVAVVHAPGSYDCNGRAA
jgi:hypothetical protein